MTDTIEKIGKSMIQHGKLNDRVYVMKLDKDDFDKVIERTEHLCEKQNYTKIFAKVPEVIGHELMARGYKKEAEISNFYDGSENCLFLGKFLDKTREETKDKKIVENVLNIAHSKEKQISATELKVDFHLKSLSEQNAKEMSEVYKVVFASYPFPIFDPNYLIKTMRDNVEYAGIWHKNTLVSIASAEKYPLYKNAEMTDFATLPEYAGNNLSVVLLKYLEKKMIRQGYKTLYTIARAISAGMNITFKKCGYKYSGILKNNTNISGSIESMNIWYKDISF